MAKQKLQDLLTKNGLTDFGALQDDVEAQVKFAELSGMPIGFVTGLVQIYKSASQQPEEALALMERLIMYIEEVFDAVSSK